MTLINWFLELGPWAWLILAVVLFALETVVPGVHFAWFGVAAIVVSALILSLGISWPAQLIAFAITAVISVFLARRWSNPKSEISDTPDLNVRGAQYVGRTVTVEEAIYGGRGKVRVGDTLWVAEGPDQPVGSRVRVSGVNGTVLMVEPTAT